MWTLIYSTDFWFGAAMLGAYQIAKFREISTPDPNLAARQALIPNLQASDFAGKVTFFFTLAAFLIATFLTYFVLCNVSPTILQGWAQVSGAQPGEELEKFVDSVPYPLYIAAAFIGFTQPGIPLLSNIGNVQRNLFHAWIGVPRRVMSTSSFFSNQIFNRSPDGQDLAKELQVLISDAWVERIDAYADADFYRSQLARLKLDDEADVRELLKGSRRELRNLTRQLVDVAALASVREGGMGSLARLGRDLRVVPQDEPSISKGFLSGGVLFLIGMTLVWNVIPLFDSWAARFLSAGSKIDFWPNNLEFSGQYLISQAGPIFLASGAALATWLGAFRRAETTSLSGAQPLPGMIAHFNRYAGLFAWVVIGIVVYDLLQAFFDYGFYKGGTASGFWAFIPANLPFYLLHSFVSLVVCFVALLYMDDGLHLPGRTMSTLAVLMVGVALVSVLYTAARVQFVYKLPFGDNGIDMAVLVVVINVSAAVLSFASAALCKRQAEASRTRPHHAPSRELPHAPAVAVTGAQPADVPLASPAAAGG